MTMKDESKPITRIANPTIEIGYVNKTIIRDKLSFRCSLKYKSNKKIHDNRLYNTTITATTFLTFIR
ncbi:hypothetical protein CLV62_13813 [Dysgonomonas alginatilytica]|uniref:Uncharacterized protein n=1 Tax=Dysgonomonas alginatilytica TaxID=1605892 RepID=A0A2V3PL15_9BACT|nr:hypothetical protein CLV62_13813 [Dysgonomonas alginatilytica]